MEKLQNALSKAREQRQTVGQPKIPTPAPARRAAVSATAKAAAKAPAQPKKEAVVSGDTPTPPAPAPEKRVLKQRALTTRVPLDQLTINTWNALMPFEPDLKQLTRNRVMSMSAHTASGPFDNLRTKILLMMQQNDWTRLAITSPTVSCGKTTTACNLAAGLSRQLELKSMLFDMDFRRPGVARTMGASRPEHGIRKLLMGEVTASEQLVRLRSNVAISMATNAVPDPTQILIAQQTSDILDKIEMHYQPDVMIFDLPPMLATDDALAFLKNVDCAVIVARAEHTKTSQLDTCEREVAEHTNVLGVVLNGCRHTENNDSYYGE